MVGATGKKTQVILTDENVAIHRDSSDDEVDHYQENGSTPLKSHLGTKVEHYSDEDSYLSESAEEARARVTSADFAGKASLDHLGEHWSSSDEENDEGGAAYRDTDRISHHPNFQSVRGMILREISAPSLEGIVKPTLGHKEDLRIDECDEEGNYAIDNEQERARLMEAGLAAQIPDADSFGSSSDESGDESDKGGPRFQSSKMAHGSVNFKNCTTNSDAMRNYAIDNEQERARVMQAGLAAQIPDSDSFGSSDESESEEQEESEGSSFGSSKESSSESSNDDGDEESFEQQQGKSSKTSNHRRNSSQISSRRYNPINAQDDLAGGENITSDDSNGGKRGKKKSKRKAINNSSYTEMPTFKWSNVKTKIFRSFRMLKSSGYKDGSRTISVKNIAREVTKELLLQFFEDSGIIVHIRMIPHEEQGRLSSQAAYVEFESVAAARNAMQKSGKSLKGRVISCDIAYESSHSGTHSTQGSSHSGNQHVRHKSAEDISRPRADPAPSLNSVEHKLQDGDAKFLSRFDQPVYASSNNHLSVGHKPDPDHTKQSKRPNSYVNRARELARAQITSREVMTVVPRNSSYCEGYSTSFEFPIAPRRTGPAGEYDQSDYFDAQILEVHQPPLSLKGSRWKIKGWPWRRWKTRKHGKRTAKLLWPWRRLCWRWWHFAKLSTKWTKRENGSSEPKRVSDVGKQPNYFGAHAIPRDCIDKGGLQIGTQTKLRFPRICA